MTANCLISCLQSAASATANSLNSFGTPGGPNYGVGGSNGVEGNNKVPVGIAGTLSNFSIYQSQNNTGGSSTNRVRHNGANGGGVITAGGTGGFTDSVHTDALAVGDTFDFLTNAPCCVGSTTTSGWTAVYQATTCCGPLACVSNGIGGSNFSGTSPQYCEMGSFLTAPTSGFTNTMPAATLSNLFANVGGTTGGSNTATFTVQINGAPGTQSIVGTTGIVRDTTDTDTILAGSLVNVAAAFTPITKIYNSVGFWQSVPQGSPFYVGGMSGNAVTITGGTTVFLPLGGRATGTQTTEGQARAYIPYAWTWTNLGLVVTSNTLAASATYVSRVTSVTKNQSITITAGATGTFQDTVHSDTLAPGNFVNQQFTGGTSGSLGVSEVFNYLTDPVAATIVNVPAASALGVAAGFGGQEADASLAAVIGVGVAEPFGEFVVNPAVGIGHVGAFTLSALSVSLPSAIGVGSARGGFPIPVETNPALITPSAPLACANTSLKNLGSIFLNIGPRLST